MRRRLARLICPALGREYDAMYSTLRWYADELHGARARACLTPEMAQREVSDV